MLFTGEFWTGQKALELGLVDGLSDLRGKMREIYGDEVRLKLVMPSTSWLRRRRSVFAEGRALEFSFLPGGFAADLISAIEARALWSRFGF
jgi:serine protease SohB